VGSVIILCHYVLLYWFDMKTYLKGNKIKTIKIMVRVPYLTLSLFIITLLN